MKDFSINKNATIMLGLRVLGGFNFIIKVTLQNGTVIDVPINKNMTIKEVKERI
jgi:hypothetical protein